MPIGSPHEPGRRRSSGGFPPSNGGDGEGPDDNGSGGKLTYKKHDPIDDEPDTVPDKAKVITWFLLIVVLMTFGGLIAALAALAHAWRGQSDA